MATFPVVIVRFRCDTIPSWCRLALAAGVGGVAATVGALGWSVHPALGVLVGVVAGSAMWSGTLPKLRWAHAIFDEVGVQLVLEPKGALDHDLPDSSSERVEWRTRGVARWAAGPDTRHYPWTSIGVVTHRGWVDTGRRQTISAQVREGLFEVHLEDGTSVLALKIEGDAMGESGRVATAANDLRNAALQRALTEIMASMSS